MEKMYDVLCIRYMRGGRLVEYYRIIVHNKISYYTKYEELGEGYAKVMKNGKWGIVTPYGNIWGTRDYTKIHEFSEDMIRVEKNGLFGYMDRRTGRIINCTYENATDFKNGIASVVYHGKQKTINILGKFID